MRILLMVHMLGIGSPHLGFRCLHLKICHFLSSSRGVVSRASKFHDDYQQGIGLDATSCWCISIETNLFTWAIMCYFIEGCVWRIHLGSIETQQGNHPKGNSTQNLVYTDALGN
jgi:hypothetical protein